MGKKRVLISYGIDVDAVAGWLGSYGGEDSTSDISRGAYELTRSFCPVGLSISHLQNPTQVCSPRPLVCKGS